MDGVEVEVPGVAGVGFDEAVEEEGAPLGA